jgi:hypothetical protein
MNDAIWKERLRHEGYVRGTRVQDIRIQSEDDKMRMEREAKEAEICLSCPLKKCRPSDCTRYKKEMISRGLYEGNPKRLR